jgi:hypothetical protein
VKRPHRAVINKALPACREAVEARPGDNLRRKVAVARLCRSGNEGLSRVAKWIGVSCIG